MYYVDVKVTGTFRTIFFIFQLECCLIVQFIEFSIWLAYLMSCAFGR
jgi:hypothetical protein